MWFIINILQFILINSFTFICILLALPLSLVGYPKGSYFVANKIWGPFLLFIVRGKLIVKGLENIDRNKTYIYSANHMSNFDIPILFTVIPVALHFIAKKELKRIPLFGWCITAMGMIFIDRKNKSKALESMKAAGKLITDGKNVITFPEGKRSRSNKIEIFRRGTFIIAKESQIDIIPIAIKGSNILHKPGGIKMRPGTVSINIGKPLEAELFKNKTPEQLAEYTKEKVEELYLSA